jgi:hypothetical protein
MRQLPRLMASALFGKASGSGVATIIFRDLGDSKNRITATSHPMATGQLFFWVLLNVQLLARFL